MEQPIAARVVEGTTLSVVVGDITTLTLDAIVNAANSSLLGGGGVEGPSTAPPVLGFWRSAAP